MKQQINIEEVHAKITEERGQNMIKSRKLFFQFSKFVKINCRENVLEDKNAKINIREQKFIYSIHLNIAVLIIFNIEPVLLYGY